MGIDRNRMERIWMLAKMEFLKRYFGSSLGLLWALINPLARLVVYYLVFSYLIFRQNDPMFVLYLFCGLIIWGFFSESTTAGIRVLISKRYLIENIQINKIDIYLAHVITTFLGLLFNMLSYLVMSAFFPVSYSFYVLYVPLILLILYVFAFSVSILLSIIYIYLKDLDHIWDIVLLIGFWTIPIIWDQKFVLNDYMIMHYSNPITGLLINMRNILLYDTSPDMGMLAYDAVYTLALLAFSLFILKRFGHKAAEIT